MATRKGWVGQGRSLLISAPFDQNVVDLEKKIAVKVWSFDAFTPPSTHPKQAWKMWTWKKKSDLSKFQKFLNLARLLPIEKKVFWDAGKAGKNCPFWTPWTP